MSVRFSRSNLSSGKSNPKTLIIIGSLSLVTMLVIGFVVVNSSDPEPESNSGGYLDGLSEADIQAKTMASMTNLKQIYIAVIICKIDNQDQYPDSLDAVPAKFLPEKVKINPLDKAIPYAYIKPKKPEQMGDIVLYDPIVVKDKVRAAYMDGSVATLPLEKFKKQLADQGVEAQLIEK